MGGYLLVSSSDRMTDYLVEFLSPQEDVRLDSARSANQARRLLIGQEYDVVIINVPLSDESGTSLAFDLSEEGVSSVILLVKSGNAEQIQEYVGSEGIFVVEKPIIRQVLQSALRFSLAAKRKMDRILEKQGLLKQQLEDFKIIDRAKCSLIEYLGMTEAQAHRHIEKQAMDLRRSRRSVAEDILRIYEM